MEGRYKLIKADITVVWQSLVVSPYRRFFAELAEHVDGEINLVAPHRFRELGSQWLDCAPDQSTRYKFFVLKALILHVQIVWFRGLRRLWNKLVKTDRKQIFICLAEPYSFTALFCYLALRLSSRKPDAFVLYGLQNIDKRHPLVLRLIQSFLFKRATHILYTGDEQKYVLQRQGYLGPTLPFPLWFDQKHFDLQPRERQRYFAELNASKVWLGYAGSLLEEKGLEDLFAALSLLSEDIRRQLALVVAGKGPLQSYVIEQLDKLKSLGIETHFAGALPAELMPTFYSQLDFLLIPSRTRPFWKEQFGRVIVEAEACGAVALGSDSGAIPEVIGDASRIFKEEKEEDFSKTLEVQLERFLVLNEEEKVLSRKKMRARALQRYGDKKLSERFAVKLSSHFTH